MAGDVQVNGADPGTGAFLSADVRGIAIRGAGSNDIDFSAFQIASFPDLTTLTVDGGGGAGEFLAPNASTDFYVTEPDAGVLGGTAFTSTTSGINLQATFQAIPNLTGGAAANDFLFSPGASLSGAIHGGASGDTLDLGAMNGPLSVVLTGSTGQGFEGTASFGTASFIKGGFSNIATMKGPLDRGTLTGENLPSTWTLNDAPTYSDGTHTLAFQNFQTLQAGNGGDTFEIIGNAVGQVTANLVGGSGDDTFNFHGAAQLVGSFDGKAGFDTLSYAAFGSSVSVQITGSDASGYSGTEGLTFSGGGFQGIDNIIASPSAAGSSILAGDDLTSTWDLGATQTYSDGSVTPLGFSGFAILQAGAGANTFNVLASSTVNLNGGAGNDSFVFSDGAVLHGSIDGQGGVNTLDLGGYHHATEVNLAAGTASVLDGTLANIQDVTGGTAADTITGDSADSTFISNGTSDLLVGGPGNDTNVLTLPANSSTSVTDNQGNNSLDFSRAGTGIVLNLDSTAVQTVASGRQLQIHGRFRDVIGTPFADEISTSATAYDRTISGGPAGSASGDILRVDVGGHVASRTPTAVLIEGMGTIFYSHFSQVILVNQATPTITWANPADITLGTALGDTQLDATATGIDGTSLAGTFAYTPAAGTVLGIGKGQTLSAVFTPTDTTDYTSTTATATINVGQASTTINLTASANPSVYGQSVTFTATVGPVSPGVGVPTGTVTFMNSTATLGTGTLSSTGVATFSTSSLTASASPYSIKAVYSGDTNFTTSTSSALSQMVNQAGTTTTLTSSANPSTSGQSVTFTATVAAVSPGTGTPTGTVNFLDNGTTIGTEATLTAGVATFTTSSLAVGTQSITAVYSGDTNFTTSTSRIISQAVNQAVNQAVTLNQVLVEEDYHVLLNRSADPGGLTAWSTQLNNGATPNSVGMAFVNSTESETDIVTNDYQNFLHRAPDPGGLAAWLGQLRSGSTPDQVAADFLGSAEYFADHGSTNQGFVSALYLDVLGRTPDSGGNMVWLNVLASGVSRTQVAFDFLTSPEAVAKQVTVDYSGILNRSPDTGGLNSWVTTLIGPNPSLTNQQVAVDFIDGADNINRINTAIAQMSDATVDQIAMSLLGPPYSDGRSDSISGNI